MPVALVATSWMEVIDTETGEIDRAPLLLSALSQQREVDPTISWSWSDVTGQQLEPGTGRFRLGSPNTVFCLGTFSDNALAFIDTQSDLRVLYDDGSRLATRILTNAQFNQVRNFLAQRLGWTTTQIDAGLGTSVGGRTVAQLVAGLISYLRSQ